MDRNLIRVRVLSAAAAGAITALALMAFARYRVNADIDEGAPAIAIPAFVENPQTTEIVTAPPRQAPIGTPSLTGTHGDRDNSLRLWRYGPNNEVVFSYAEQFDRCTEARHKHIDQADCPGSRETRIYVLDQSADAPLVLTYRRH
jgi:hypothetical protein